MTVMMCTLSPIFNQLQEEVFLDASAITDEGTGLDTAGNGF